MKYLFIGGSVHGRKLETHGLYTEWINHIVQRGEWELEQVTEAYEPHVFHWPSSTPQRVYVLHGMSLDDARDYLVGGLPS